MRTPHKIMIVLGLVIVCAAGAVAAAHVPAPAEARDFGGTLPTLADPLEAYGTSLDVVVLVQNAENILVQECMSSAGYSYTGVDVDGLESSFIEAAGRLYGITDPAVASTYGYSVDRTSSSTVSAADSSDGYAIALTGYTLEEQMQADPNAARGCVGQARATLTGTATGNPPEGALLGRELQTQAWAEIWTDPRATKAVEEWAACMADEGYEADNPLSPETLEHRDVDDSGAAADEEIARASADITCKAKTKFIARVSAVHFEIAEGLIATHLAELQASKEFNDNALKAAQAIIG